MNHKEIEKKLDELRDAYDAIMHSKRSKHEPIVNEFILLITDYKDYEMQDRKLDMDAFDFIYKAEKNLFRPCIPQNSYTFIEDSELAKIMPSGEKMSDIAVKVGDFIEDIKSFIAVSPISWIVGGVVNNEKGSQNDVDILITVPERKELEKIIMFRIARMVNKDIRKRISFLPEPNRSYVGPFTNNLPLFRLTVERIPDAEVQKMAEDADVKLRIKSEDVEKRTAEANKAIINDKITPGEYYKPAKPVRGYINDKPQTVTLFLDIYDKNYEYPALSSKKLDGSRLLVSKIQDKTIIFSEDGSKLDKLHNLKSLIKNLDVEKLVVEGELENWDYGNKQHLPRESVNTNIDDDNFVLNVFDCLYFKGEIPDALYSEIEYYDKEGIENWKKKYLS